MDISYDSRTALIEAAGTCVDIKSILTESVTSLLSHNYDSPPFPTKYRKNVCERAR